MSKVQVYGNGQSIFLTPGDAVVAFDGPTVRVYEDREDGGFIFSCVLKPGQSVDLQNEEGVATVRILDHLRWGGPSHGRRPAAGDPKLAGNPDPGSLLPV